MENGTFLTEDKKCYYLYELTMNGRVQTGVAACASIDDYENGIIKKHENTSAEKEVDRIRHVDVCNAQTGPIFLAYRANDGIRRIVEKTKQGEPEYDFTSGDGVRHRVLSARMRILLRSTKRLRALTASTLQTDTTGQRPR